ncbi:MAG: phage holin family protein [Kofleriaceae bacterium]|nr:phage holin family protein [Kofleriaceae bacterium]MBP6840677.1 phage holin family protein [Kofleriaceae bacterium]MBP9206829.1 phage holin family protein [Kofleriaceae bacterium]
MTTLLIKLAVRLVVLTGVFWLAARRNKKIVIQPKWALPLVAGVFAVLNVGLYWLLKPILNLATLGAIGFVMPLVINTLLLVTTVRIVERKKWLVIDGLVATLWMAVVLTLTHGVLWFGLDYLPPKL